jgi:hypothetical protein
VARDAVAPAVDLGAGTFTCEVEGCTAAPFRTRATLGVHRWNAHKLRGQGKHAKAKATKAPGPGADKKEVTSQSTTTPRSPSPGTSTKPAGRRKDGTKFCGGAWKLAAKYMVPRVSPPAAKVMEWQASYAGGILDAAIAGTRLDRLIVQRAVGKGADLAALKDLLGLPALMVLGGAQPALAFDSTFQEMLRSVVQANFKSLLAGRLKQQKEERELENMAAEAGESYWATDGDGNVLLDGKGRKISMVDGLTSELLGMLQQPAEAPMAAAA